MQSTISKIQNKISTLVDNSKRLLLKINKSNLNIKNLLDLMSLPMNTEFNTGNLSTEENILKDNLFENKVLQTWRAYLKKKHELNNLDPNKKTFNNFMEEMKSLTQDDIVCVICNDGDYEENDLIVYCSSCQLTVHQNCYGIQSLPDEDWICNVCLVFPKEEINNVECCLCSVKGGAMKLSHLKKNSAFFKKINRLRGTNLSNKFEIEIEDEIKDELILSNPVSNVIQESFKLEIERNESIDIINSIKEDKCHKSKKGKKNKASTNCIKNKNQVLSNTEIYNIYKSQVIKRANEYTWVHVSCAIWNPNVIIEDFPRKEEIKSKIKH